MNAIDQLNAYLHGIERRLRLMALSRGAAITAVCALLVTVLLVLITNSFAFSPTSLLWARILLFLSLAVAIVFGLVMPLLRMNRRSAASAAHGSAQSGNPARRPSALAGPGDSPVPLRRRGRRRLVRPGRLADAYRRHAAAGASDLKPRSYGQAV